MTDPLDALREPPRPVDPDPAFAARLRARLERAVLAPTGFERTERADRTGGLEDAMTATTATTAITQTAPPAEPRTITAYLTVTDARAAVEFYIAVFGAARRGEPIVMPDGRVGHAELTIGDSVLMLADEFPDLGLLAPVSRGGPTQTLHLDVDDPDAVVARAARLGATVERPVAEATYGRAGVVRDHSGHRWMLVRQPPSTRQGDVVFTSLWVPDAAIARRFFDAALGFVPDLHGGHEQPTLMPCFGVADLDASVARVRAAGGTATEPQDRPYGRVSDAIDDHGLPFALRQGPAAPPQRPAAVQLRHPDTASARAFYGTVLGWGFDPATEPGGWHVRRADGAAPAMPVRLAETSSDPVAIPVFTVDDLDAALAAVRAAGGTTTASGHCTDPQGTPFALRLETPPTGEPA